MSQRTYKITEDAKSGPIIVETNDEVDFSCGLGNWRPKWLQNYATARFFIINFAIVGILQGAFFTYLVGIMTTLEKRYSFDTKVNLSYWMKTQVF